MTQLSLFGEWVGRSKFRRMTTILLGMAFAAWSIWSELPGPWHTKLLVMAVVLAAIVEWPRVRGRWILWRGRRAALKCWRR